MAALPDHEWLHLAKRVAIGSQMRHRHGAESRMNLVVGNTGDRWWAYCQSCKRGGRVLKEHAMLVKREPEGSRSLTLPHDMRTMTQLEPHELTNIMAFLAGKNMDRMYLPYDLFWSASRHRLLIHSDGHWLGRDTSGHSPQKWLTYNGQHYLQVRHVGYAPAVVTEDAFSAYKVAWATRGELLNVYCSLGTAIHDTLLARLIESTLHGDAVSSFYDGDAAGRKGCATNEKRLRAFGIHTNLPPEIQCAPEGLDPKDMRIDDIKKHLAIMTRKE